MNFKLTPRHLMWTLLVLILCALTALSPVIMLSLYGIIIVSMIFSYFLTYFVYCLMENKWLTLKEFDELVDKNEII